MNQHSTLVKEDFIETQYEGGTGDADGRARDAKHGDPLAYKGLLLRIFAPPRGRLRKSWPPDQMRAGEEGDGVVSWRKKTIEVRFIVGA